jgi:hypothetical protein
VNSAAPLVLPAQAQHHRARERDGMGLSDACVDGDLTSLSLSLLQSIAGQQPPSICICICICMQAEAALVSAPPPAAAACPRACTHARRLPLAGLAAHGRPPERNGPRHAGAPASADMFRPGI